MAKLPSPPSDGRLGKLSAPVRLLKPGMWLARIGFAGGDHPSAWSQLRHWGPGAGRFDHHLPDENGQPHQQQRGILYAAADYRTCIAEVFQQTRVVDVTLRLPYLAVWQNTAILQLLDLTGAFVTRMGASTAIHSGNRGRTRQWAQVLYAAWRELDGISYCSSMNGNAESFALNERALAKHPFPDRPASLRMLGDPLMANEMDDAAWRLGYIVKR